jgi:hypothetical protein
MPKQLNIRSDEAYERAHRLARQNGVSVTRVVEEALEKLEPNDEDHDRLAALTDEQRARYLRLRALSEYGRRHKRRGSTSDHHDFYDDKGLPK